MGTSVVTVGTRHAKVWRLQQAMPVSPSKPRATLDSPVPSSPHDTKVKAFAGRNCLLGPLSDAVFTCISVITSDMAILGTVAGIICLLDDSNQSQQVLKVAEVGFGIKCMSIDRIHDCVWVGGDYKRIKALPLQSLLNRDSVSFASSGTDCSASGNTLERQSGPDLLALATIRGQVLTVDSDHIAHFMEVRRIGTTLDVVTPSKSLEAHRSAILGLTKLQRPNDFDSDFLTWSTDGTVYFWDRKGQSRMRLEVFLEQTGHDNDGESNVLKAVRVLDSGQVIVTGDSMGVLMLIRTMDEHILYSAKAHGGEINDIATVQKDVDMSIVASAGRDRIIQIFRKLGDQLTMLQTLHDHIGAVCQLTFLNEGNRLLSSSADRTISVRSVAFGKHGSMAYVTHRILSLNKSPVSFSTVPNASDIILVSTTDKQVSTYNTTSGRLVRTMKAIDPESQESMLLSSIKAVKLNGQAHQSPFLIGVSSSDKSIGLYELESGALLAKAYGHTEGISDCDLLHYGDGSDGENNFVASTGYDGMVIIWDVSTGRRYSGEILGCEHTVGGTPDPPNSLMTSQPLRRILSRSELQSFQMSPETNGETLTPVSSPSPTRIRRKKSSYITHNAPKRTPPFSATDMYHTRAPTSNDSPLRRMIRDRSPTPPSTKSNATSQRRRVSLKNSHRTMSADDIKDINVVTKQTCHDLRTLRSRLENSSSGLKRNLAEELGRELALTVRTISDTTRRQQAASETTVSDLLGVYSDQITQMIDEKVAESLARHTLPPSVELRTEDTVPSASGASETANES